MKKWGVFLLGVIVALGISACGIEKGKSVEDKPNNTAFKDEKIVISAAASLQEALTELQEQFINEQQLQKDQIFINFGGSGALRRQIEQGAPAALFISASETHMKALVDKSLVREVKPLVINDLVMIVPKGKNSYDLKNIQSVTRLAIGEPESVPAGRYAKDTLMHLQLWSAVEDKVIFGKDVRSVLAYVSEGAVDAGFVYKTDALQGKDRVQITDTAPSDSHKPIIYPMALVVKENSALARAFYDYLLSQRAQSVFEKYGFGIMVEK